MADAPQVRKPPNGVMSVRAQRIGPILAADCLTTGKRKSGRSLNASQLKNMCPPARSFAEAVVVAALLVGADADNLVHVGAVVVLQLQGAEAAVGEIRCVDDVEATGTRSGGWDPSAESGRQQLVIV